MFEIEFYETVTGRSDVYETIVEYVERMRKNAKDME